MAARLLSIGTIASTPLAAQDTSLEEFAATDPYTKGRRELLDKLGYVSFGPFHWADTQTSEDVRSILGGTAVLFVETPHFRIASTLGTYDPVGDRREKELLEAELGRLKRRLGRLKVGRELDPWLRLHLYAQRLEELYQDFLDRFGFEDGDFPGLPSGPSMGAGPFLGQKDKFTVLLCGTESALGRYLTSTFSRQNEFYFRWAFRDCYFLGISSEALTAIDRELDVGLYTTVVAAMTLNLVEAFRGAGQNAPEWFELGLAHFYSRRIDPRWNNWGAGGNGDWETDDFWVWEPRVRGLVANDAATPWEEMLAWRTPSDVEPREHMLAWSRVSWLLEEKPEGLRQLALALTEPIPGASEEERAKAAIEQQRAALEKAFGKTLPELDAEWEKFVLRRYEK